MRLVMRDTQQKNAPRWAGDAAIGDETADKRKHMTCNSHHAMLLRGRHACVLDRLGGPRSYPLVVLRRSSRERMRSGKHCAFGARRKMPSLPVHSFSAWAMMMMSCPHTVQ
jgi:hypothetical protein